MPNSGDIISIVRDDNLVDVTAREAYDRITELSLEDFPNVAILSDEIYSNITTPEGILLEYASSAIRQSAPVYQFIDYLNTLGRILTEDDDILVQESGD